MEKWLAPFATRDAFAHLVAFEKFEKEVPASDRTATLVALWDAAAKEKESQRDLIRGSIIGYVATRGTAVLPWTDALKKLVKDATRETSADVRGTALAAIVNRGAAIEMRDEIVRSLDDSNEMVRDRAIDIVDRWPDRAKILQDYVHRNESKAAQAATVERAKSLIKKAGVK